MKRLIADYRDCIGVTDRPRSFGWNSRDELAGWSCSSGRQNGDATQFFKKYAAHALLVIDKWLLDHPDEAIRNMLRERRCDATWTVLHTQYAKKGLAPEALSKVHADAIMNRIHNMRARVTMG